jgi:hypothetical protein
VKFRAPCGLGFLIIFYDLPDYICFLNIPSGPDNIRISSTIDFYIQQCLDEFLPAGPLNVVESLSTKQSRMRRHCCGHREEPPTIRRLIGHEGMAELEMSNSCIHYTIKAQTQRCKFDWDDIWPCWAVFIMCEGVYQIDVN